MKFYIKDYNAIILTHINLNKIFLPLTMTLIQQIQHESFKAVRVHFFSFLVFDVALMEWQQFLWEMSTFLQPSFWFMVKFHWFLKYIVPFNYAHFSLKNFLIFSRDRDEDENITQEERDARTVFIMQLARNVTIRDIQDFFSKVGQVRDVRLISDRNSRRSKGIGYVEFTDPSAVTLVSL